MNPLASPEHGSDTAGVIGGVVGFTVAFTVGVAQYRRRLRHSPVRDQGQARLLYRAMRSGEVPEGADTSGWRAYLDDQTSPARRRRIKLLLVATVGFAVLGLVLAGVGAWVEDWSTRETLSWLVVPILPLMSALLTGSTQRSNRRRSERLRQRLDEAE